MRKFLSKVYYFRTTPKRTIRHFDFSFIKFFIFLVLAPEQARPQAPVQQQSVPQVLQQLYVHVFLCMFIGFLQFLFPAVSLEVAFSAKATIFKVGIYCMCRMHQ